MQKRRGKKARSKMRLSMTQRTTWTPLINALHKRRRKSGACVITAT